ncbi:hypothetical protein MiSe_01890 [Microseira wollei NIES-4236]|uniref:Uncharacterized protein n=1 Tax=Microseira wollei NIES-4236 TaxID=2530354 RepID=A0AAV3WYN1_9CYAN|nr:hypothetical protein MiSe_01890 [Microseira wollei NIES-4236]
MGEIVAFMLPAIAQTKKAPLSGQFLLQLGDKLNSTVSSYLGTIARGVKDNSERDIWTHLPNYPQMIFCIVAATEATYNYPLQIGQMANNTPRRQLLSVTHAPLPVVEKQGKTGAAVENDCGVGIIEYASNCLVDNW